jgi:hypothetical protein
MKVKVLSRSSYDYMRETKHDIHRGIDPNINININKKNI